MRVLLSEDRGENRAVIKVVGVGGGGCNAIKRMVEAGLEGVELIAANTDVQSLQRCPAATCVQLGEELTRGLGVGSDFNRGRAAALESEGALREVLAGADLIFVATGMGGGTGTGGAPVIARLAKEAGALTVGVVTRPFEYEGLLRASVAEQGIQDMRQSVDTLLTIPNQRLLDVIDPQTSHLEAFRAVDDVLRRSVQAISDIIAFSGDINVDLADLRTVMKDAGEALIGIGESSGPERALTAAREAMQSSLLENVVIDGAKGLIVSISTARGGIAVSEIEKINATIMASVSPEVRYKWGQYVDHTLGEGLRVTVIATGFPARRRGGPAQRAGARGAAARPPGAPGRAAPAPPSDAAALQSSRDEDRWTKPAYLRFKARRLK